MDNARASLTSLFSLPKKNIGPDTSPGLFFSEWDQSFQILLNLFREVTLLSQELSLKQTGFVPPRGLNLWEEALHLQPFSLLVAN